MEREDELTTLLAVEETLLSAEGCMRMAAHRLSGSDPLRDVLEEMLRELEEIVARARSTKNELVQTGV